jgi:hypothetical protein
VIRRGILALVPLASSFPFKRAGKDKPVILAIQNKYFLMILGLKMPEFDRNNMDYSHLEGKVKPSLQA